MVIIDIIIIIIIRMRYPYNLYMIRRYIVQSMFLLSKYGGNIINLTLKIEFVIMAISGNRIMVMVDGWLQTEWSFWYGVYYNILTTHFLLRP
jgi:hypothetical protein